MNPFSFFQKNKLRRIRKIGLIGLILLLAGAVQNSQALRAALAKSDYDAFVSLPAYTVSHSIAKKAAAEFLTYPFEIIRWPLNKTLVFMEEKRITAKTRHVLHKLNDHGITPRLMFKTWGADFDIPKLLKLDSTLPPELNSKTWVNYSPERIFDTGTSLGLSPTDGSGLQTRGLIQYEDRPEEDFYGLGPHSSKGDKASYEMQTFTAKTLAGFSPTFAHHLNAYFIYKDVRISNSGGRDTIPSTFPNRMPAAGLQGDHLITAGTEASWSPGQDSNPMHSAPLIKASADYNEGLYDSRARYFKFLTEFSKSFELGSPLRIFSARFHGEHLNALPGRDVPFHQMPRLGGFGVYPNPSQLLRSYDENRFYAETSALFNLEYRYRIYEYRQWTLSHILFFDQGQSFHKLSKFQYGNFRESYGTGFRLAFLKRVLVDIEMAHGDEGTVFHFRNTQPF